jgi:hypothetical protein
MAQCEYRISSGDIVSVSGKDAFVFTRPNNPVCEVKAENLAPNPICELPEASTASCPIAQFKKGTINLEETNKQLTAIFEAEKGNRK